MELVQHVYSVLAISTREKFYTSLRGLLPEDRYSPLCWESDVTSARRLLLERTFDIVVISTPLPDEFGTKLAMHVVDSSSAGVLLLVGAGLGVHPDKIMIGNIMLVIPGIQLTTSLRDMINGDTISGLLNLSEAILKAISVALGFALVLLAGGV